ncbi:MAG: MDR family MFS transporter [Actinomycetaceae bacterium]|nr:MFS transporter [Arcanobacterium sp.]MDD7505069.1 MDR family MFS transporter [Actinomycetaceae bacterium]
MSDTQARRRNAKPQGTSQPNPPAEFHLSKANKRIFIALLLGMFSAAMNQTIVGPAMPRIIAELGGMAYYSWVATTALLSSALVTPIVGKLSDMYGRRKFYIAGLITFIAGAAISGAAQSFAWLIVGRAVTGAAMGTLMPLSQTIIGDIIPPRQRGKYQGYMGAVFGVATVAGPIIGGAITDAFGWRWLFYCALPLCAAALVMIVKSLHLEFTPTRARVDVLGMALLSIALMAVLLASSWGGTTYAWNSGVIIGLFITGTIATALFILQERRAEAPVVPLHLFKNSIFTLSTTASLVLAMVMFGSLTYLPIFAQGVLGVSATISGIILMPMSVVQIVVGIVIGRLITRTGHYKEFMSVGIVIMAIGQGMLLFMDTHTAPGYIAVAMVVFGFGLGMAIQQYMLVVQNAVPTKDLGVATAATQFFRNIGSTVGISIFGTVMNTGLAERISYYMPKGMVVPTSGLNAGSVLDANVAHTIPPIVANAVRLGLSDRLHWVFLAGIPLIVIVLVLTVPIKPIPLRQTLESQEEAQREYFATMGQTDSRYAQEQLAAWRTARQDEQVLGVQFEMLARTAARSEHPLLDRAVTNLGDGDFTRGLRLLERTAEMFTTNDAERVASLEKYAAEVGTRADATEGLVNLDIRRDATATLRLLDAAESEQRGGDQRGQEHRSSGDTPSSTPHFGTVDSPAAASATTTTSVGRGKDTAPNGVIDDEPTVAERYESVNIEKLKNVSSELTTLLLIDLARIYRS